MIICPNCGNQNNEGSKFCVTCGCPLQNSAPSEANRNWGFNNAAPFQPNGAQPDPAAGQYQPFPPQAQAQNDKKSSKTAIIIIAVVAVVIIAAIAAVTVVMVLRNNPSNITNPTKSSSSQTLDEESDDKSSEETDIKNEGDTDKVTASKETVKNDFDSDEDVDYYSLGDDDYPSTAVVMTGSSNLNIRKSPNKNAEIKGKVPSDEIVEILGYQSKYDVDSKSKNIWVYVVYTDYDGNTTKGWAYQEYLATVYIPDGPEEYGEVDSGHNNFVFLRSKPDKNSSDLAHLTDGETVEIFGYGQRESEGWVWVYYRSADKLGWITAAGLDY